MLASTLANESLLMSEEAIVAAAAAEAVALAKAAVKIANDAALMLRKSGNRQLEADSAHLARVPKTEGTGIVGERDFCPRDEELDDSGPTDKELELLQEQLTKSIAVRSKRQTERKFRRARAAEKAAASVVSVKSGSSSRKKRTSLQDVDYSDPLRYLRGTTSTTRLLTATEELELSEGIQVLLKPFCQSL